MFRTLFLEAAEEVTSPYIRPIGQHEALLHPGALPGRLRLTFYMKALVTLAHRPAGLTLRKNVLNLRFGARQIALGWLPRWSASWLGCRMNLLIFSIVRHNSGTLSSLSVSGL